MPATRSAALVLGALTLAAATGCNPILNRLEDGVVRDEAITEVKLDGGAGDITVITDSTVKGVDIRRTVRYLNGAPSIDDTIVFSGTTVALRTDCGSQCSASYQVRMPKPGLRVTGDNGSGDIRLTDVSDVDIRLGSGDVHIKAATGSVRLQAGSGDINLQDIAGNVTVSAGSGDVTGADLRGAKTAIEVSSGSISLRLPGTGDARAVTTSGDIEVWVPDRSTRISITTRSGDQHLNATPDPDSPRLLEVRTGSGDVTVSPSL